MNSLVYHVYKYEMSMCRINSNNLQLYNGGGGGGRSDKRCQPQEGREDGILTKSVES